MVVCYGKVDSAGIPYESGLFQGGKSCMALVTHIIRQQNDPLHRAIVEGLTERKPDEG